MRKKQIFFRMFTLATCMTVAFYSCKKDSVKYCDEHSVTACSEYPSKTNIRIKNNSNYNFCNVVFHPYSRQVNCGIVKKGGSTCYHSFDTAYSYAYIQLFIDDKEFKLQPIDFVGEQPLGIGEFTYLLDILDFNSRQVSITLQKD